MTEQEARAAIIAWAQSHYGEDYDEVPTVKVMSITPCLYGGCDAWEAELEVHSREVNEQMDNPTITFLDETDEGGLEVQVIES